MPTFVPTLEKHWYCSVAGRDCGNEETSPVSQEFDAYRVISINMVKFSFITIAKHEVVGSKPITRSKISNEIGLHPENCANLR